MPPKPTPAGIEKHMAALETTPARLQELAQGLTDEALAATPAPKVWSPVEILAHLRSCSDIWSYSILAMLAESSPALALLHPRKWARAARYPALGFHRSLEAFTLNRLELLAVLRGLAWEQWLRDAKIAGRKHTVYSQARRMALHEGEHLAQFEAAVRAVRAPS